MGVDARAVAAIGRKPNPHGGEKLGIGDVLLLCCHHAARDLEALGRRQAAGQEPHDPVVFAGEQGLSRGQLGVVIGPDVTGHHGLLWGGLDEALSLHVWRFPPGSAGVRFSEVATWEHQLGSGVGQVAVVGALQQPVQTASGLPVDRRGVDVRALGVDLKTGMAAAVPGPRRRRIAGEVDLARVIAVGLERIRGAERNRRLSGSGLRQSKGVIEELAPHPPPLAHVASREKVDAERVEDPIADVARARPGNHLPDAVGIPGRGQAPIDRARFTPGWVGQVVPSSVEALGDERERGPGRARLPRWVQHGQTG